MEVMCCSYLSKEHQAIVTNNLYQTVPFLGLDNSHRPEGSRDFTVVSYMGEFVFHYFCPYNLNDICCVRNPIIWKLSFYPFEVLKAIVFGRIGGSNEIFEGRRHIAK